MKDLKQNTSCDAQLAFEGIVRGRNCPWEKCSREILLGKMSGSGFYGGNFPGDFYGRGDVREDLSAVGLCMSMQDYKCLCV